MNEIESMEITFNSEWFRSGYYVYILHITHNKEGNFFYIGQTGDRKHISARSPFYRLMGHFRPSSKATDAQLVKGLIKFNLIEIETENKKLRICIQDAIVNKIIKIKANYFKISDFDSLDHKNKRRFAEDVELELINKFRKINAKLFNDNNKIGHKKIVTDKKAIELAEKIFSQQVIM